MVASSALLRWFLAFVWIAPWQVAAGALAVATQNPSAAQAASKTKKRETKKKKPGKQARKPTRSARRAKKKPPARAKKSAKPSKRAAKRPGKRATRRSSKRAAKGRKPSKAATKSKGTAKERAAAKRKAARLKAAADKARKQRKALARKLKACRSRARRKTRSCRQLFANMKRLREEEKKRQAALAKAKAEAKLARRCRSRRHRNSKKCRAYLAAKRRKRMYERICGRRYGRARRKDSVARFARRHGVSEAVVRRLNNIKGKRLRRGKRYLVYRSPWEGQRLQGGVLLRSKPDELALQRPERGWGRPLTVELIAAASDRVQTSDPLATHLVVGDLSKQGGGCIPPHRSHRGGLDADIGYYMHGGIQRGWLVLAKPETIDADRTWRLLKAFLVTGRLQYAFIDHGLQASLYDAALRAGETAESLKHVFQYPRPISASKAGIIRHLRGHADHMHVRFRCPAGQPCNLTLQWMERIAQLAQPRQGGGRPHEIARDVRRRRRMTNLRKTKILPPGW